jgi:hypothetical protein
MSLDLAKLQKVRELPGGIVQAQCPACAEGGHDRKGDHLRIYADGRFGCCVCPKDKEHRKRIFALAGDKTPRGQFTLRVCGRLPMPGGSRSVKSCLTEFRGTLGTGKTESENCVPAVPSSPADDFGTLGTANFNPRARAREDELTAVGVSGEQLKDLESAVPSVPTGERLPYLTAGSTLVIPFDSPERYHWWKPGAPRQSVKETLAEVQLRMAVAERKDNHAPGV